jgi:hypothetical protein
VELDVADAAETGVEHRHLVGAHVAELPETRVRSEPFAMPAYEVGQMDAPDLLLTLDHPLDPAGQLVPVSEQCVERVQTGHDVPLVVADPASVDPSFASRGDEWRAGPAIEWLGGLDVVVVVDEQGARGGSLPLRDHHRRSARRDRLDGEAAATQQVAHVPRARLHPGPPGCVTGLGDQGRELFETRVETRFEPSVDGCEIGHLVIPQGATPQSPGL